MFNMSHEFVPFHVEHRACLYISVLPFNGWQDLRFDDRARKELLLRTEECRSSLWLDVEEREDCAAGMLRSLKEDGQ